MLLKGHKYQTFKNENVFQNITMFECNDYYKSVSQHPPLDHISKIHSLVYDP